MNPKRNPDDIEQQAAACPHWKWLPGMRDLAGSRYYSYYVDPPYPDLRDAATVALLQQRVLDLYDSDEFRIRMPTGLKMNGQVTATWEISSFRPGGLRGKRSFVAPQNADAVTIRALAVVDALCAWGA